MKLNVIFFFRKQRQDFYHQRAPVSILREKRSVRTVVRLLLKGKDVVKGLALGFVPLINTQSYLLNFPPIYTMGSKNNCFTENYKRETIKKAFSFIHFNVSLGDR